MDEEKNLSSTIDYSHSAARTLYPKSVQRKITAAAAVHTSNDVRCRRANALRGDDRRIKCVLHLHDWVVS